VASEHELWVLLGPDYAGKSTIMAQLAGHADLDWRYASYDDRFLGEHDHLVRRLRDDVSDHLAELIGHCSTDFALTLVQSAVVFLRDSAVRLRADGPVLVDSYYYKFLAKCRLAGLVNEAFFDAWRAFPRPDRVLYLDVPPAVAWRRSGHGVRVNTWETGPGNAARDRFERFQSQLRAQLLAETAGVPTTVLDGDTDRDAAAVAVEKLLRSCHA
jgi:thymidylate kinase